MNRAEQREEWGQRVAWGVLMNETVLPSVWDEKDLEMEGGNGRTAV